MQYLANAGHLDRGLVVRCMSLPDWMLDHDSQAGQIAFAGIDADGIAARLRAMPGIVDAKSRARAAARTGTKESGGGSSS